MTRKNPNSSSMLNTPIDLTSLLDVIFILLFFVIIGYTVAKSKAINEVKDYNQLKQDYANSKDKIDDLLKGNSDLQNQIEDLANKNSHYQEIDGAYNGEVIGKKVKIITISCFYSEINKSKRTIMMYTPDMEYKDIEFEGGKDDISVTTAFDYLKDNLDNYIKSVKKDDGPEKEDKTIVVLYVKNDNGQIQRRDYEKIMSIFHELEGKYDEVY